ncbi:hypothetical protein F511_20289 [Dorcoceras hygrometricum]|uniref:Integrase catalytic domain-containing protein n=1 Tax=Dorcoceras hygrometricum TaxID=472368 RepID=A0A2Z7BV79_9LAMI|nr:hypothetical protein F511_20289 [Dorcoceras hygrometricum]
MGPISYIGPKTSRAARDRPELNPRRNQPSRHRRSIAGRHIGRPSCLRLHGQRAHKAANDQLPHATSGRRTAQQFARAVSSDRPSSAQRRPTSRNHLREIGWPWPATMRGQRITDSACKNQLVVVRIQYGPFNPYIPIRSTTIGKSRVAKDPIAMHTSWRSNSDIASVTSIGYPHMSASGESSTTMYRLLHASGSHPIPPPNDPNSKRIAKEATLCSLLEFRPIGYSVQEFQDYLKENEILSQWTPPATPQLNGVAERRNRTLLDMVRSMMSFTELPTSFWGYALETAVMLLNNVHTKAVDKTPYEIWMGKPPKYSFIRIWGCPAYVKQTVGDKLDTRSILCYFIGYPRNSIGYYFYYPSETKVFVSRIATFMEREFLLDRKGKIVELEEVREPIGAPGESPAPTEPIPEMVAPRRSERIPRAPERYGFLLEDDQGDQVVGSDPRTFKEAISDADSNLWLEAMQFEFDSMHANQVWTLVNPPEGIVPIGCKWVYKRKLGPDGKVMTYKARLVAKGYTQRQGVDYDETFSPVAMFKSIRILLAIAAWYDYEIWQMDVKTAFLNGNIKEEIYMTQPEGFTSVGSEHKVCKIQRSIYGLKQASRSWNLDSMKQLRNLVSSRIPRSLVSIKR